MDDKLQAILDLVKEGKIHTLEVKSNGVDHELSEAIADALMSPDANVRSLSVNVALTKAPRDLAGEMGFTPRKNSIHDFVKNSSTLELINVEPDESGIKASDAFQTVSKNPNLRQVFFPGNMIQPFGLEFKGLRALLSNPNLHVLDIRSTNTEMGELSEALETNTTLTQLYLGDVNNRGEHVSAMLRSAIEKSGTKNIIGVDVTFHGDRNYYYNPSSGCNSAKNADTLWIERYCEANKEKAMEFVDKLGDEAHVLTFEDVKEIQERIPAMWRFAYYEPDGKNFSREEIRTLLEKAKKAGEEYGLNIEVPQYLNKPTTYAYDPITFSNDRVSISATPINETIVSEIAPEVTAAKDYSTITSLYAASDDEKTATAKILEMKSPNIVFAAPEIDNPALHKLVAENVTLAKALTHKCINAPDHLSEDDLTKIAQRLPGMLALAEEVDFSASRLEVYTMLESLRTASKKHNIPMEIPERPVPPVLPEQLAAVTAAHDALVHSGVTMPTETAPASLKDVATEFKQEGVTEGVAPDGEIHLSHVEIAAMHAPKPHAH